MITRREREILEQLAEGKQGKEIAASLYISLWTVKAHIKNIQNKLGARNSAHAVALGISKELIEVRGK